MTERPHEAMMEALAGAILHFYDEIGTVVQTLTDEELRTLIEECRRKSRPNETTNFDMPVWGIVADRVTVEWQVRLVCRDAEEHMARTGEGSYCVACGGRCTPEHQKELNHDG